jgi:hypothetical protein
VGDGGIVRSHALGSFGLDSDRVRGQCCQLRYARADRCSVWADLGGCQNQSGVEVDDFISRGPHALQGFFEKERRVGAFPARVGGGEQRADIGRGDCPEQGVGDCMKQDVAIGVASEALIVRKSDAADLERDAAFELVRVPAKSDSSFWFQVSSKSSQQSALSQIEFREFHVGRRRNLYVTRGAHDDHNRMPGAFY